MAARAKTPGSGGSRGPSRPRRLRIALTGVNSPVMRRLAHLLDSDPKVEELLLFDVIRPTESPGIPPLERARFVRVDLTLPGADREMATALKEARVRSFVHGAFLSNPARDPAWAHEIEAIGSLQVLDACAAAKVQHLLLRSTTMVYGAHHDNPAFLTEEHPLRGNRASRWVRDKMEADLQFQRYDAEHRSATVTVARLATVLAPSITHYLARYLTRPAVPVLAGFDPLMQFLDLEDAAEALWAMLRLRAGGVFNVAPEGVIPLSSVLRLGQRVPLPIPHQLVYSMAAVLWRTQLMDVPPRFLNYLRYPWNVTGNHASETFQLAPPRTSLEVVTAFYRQTDVHSDDSVLESLSS